MAVLLLTFNAPLQSWGIDSKLKDHNTDFVPSKSAVIGMIASAEGRKRDQDISDLASLRFGVRIDKEGSILEDFHVSVIGGSFGEEKDIYNNGHKTNTIAKSRTKVGHRYYLQDAYFTCGIEAEEDKLQHIAYVLTHPANALFCGRRSCPVTIDLVGNIVSGSIETALQSENQDKRAFIDTYEEINNDNIRITKDTPISFNPQNRCYLLRKSKEVLI